MGQYFDGRERKRYGKTVFDTGLELELLQEFCFVSLDIFRELLHNNGIRNKLDAWLTMWKG